MKNDFRIAINQICNQRQLPKEVVIEAIEVALVSAYKKNFGANQEIDVDIDPDTGKARVFLLRRIVQGVEDPRTEISLAEARKRDAMAELDGMVREETTPQDFGRIAAQTAKQVILQRIREAERDLTYNQFIDRAGEIVSGTVRNIDERGNVIISLGKADATLQRSERIRSEHYQQGQRLRSYVIEVQKTSRGPQILVSRTHKQFLKRLLELEVPEIFNGTVEIKAIAREPGSRSKVAVAAMQEGIDPVGSCVGVRGVRIQNVVNELSGEKIDIVAWDPDPAAFVANALSPAKVADVQVDDDTNTATVVVPDAQLSLAIGKEGQNARLAAKLTGWRIDIKSVSEAAIETERKAEQAELAAAEAARLEAAREEAKALLAEAESLMAAEDELDQEDLEAQPELAEEITALAEPEPEALETVEPGQELAELVQDATETEEPITTAQEEDTEVEVPDVFADMEEPVVMSSDVEVVQEEPQEVPAEDLTVLDWSPEDLVKAEEEDTEEELERRKKLSKQQRRQKRWQYVMDDNTGQVVAQRKRKKGRGGQDDWDEDSWD